MSASGLIRLSERRAMRMFFDRGIQMIPGLRELREIPVLGVELTYPHPPEPPWSNPSPRTALDLDPRLAHSPCPCSVYNIGQRAAPWPPRGRTASKVDSLPS